LFITDKNKQMRGEKAFFVLNFVVAKKKTHRREHFCEREKKHIGSKENWGRKKYFGEREREKRKEKRLPFEEGHR